MTMNENDMTASTELVAPVRDDLSDLSVIAGHLVEQARADGVALTGDGGLCRRWWLGRSRPGWQQSESPWI